MGQFSVDLDGEAVYLDGTWYTRSDLSRRIKAMIDAGDFNVARPSLALEELTVELQQVRSVSFRCSPDLADALTQLATRLGQSPGNILREALTQFITDANSSPPTPQPRAQTGSHPVPPAPTAPQAQPQAPAPPAQPPAPAPPAPPQAQTIPAYPSSTHASHLHPQLQPATSVGQEVQQLVDAVELDSFDVSVDATGSTHQELPKVIVEPAIAVVPLAGPGALRAAGIGVDPVVDSRRHTASSDPDLPGRTK